MLWLLVGQDRKCFIPQIMGKPLLNTQQVVNIMQLLRVMMVHISTSRFKILQLLVLLPVPISPLHGHHQTSLLTSHGELLLVLLQVSSWQQSINHPVRKFTYLLIMV